MSSILNKTLRCLVAVVLCLCMCLSFAGCSSKTVDIEGADQICVSGSYAQSFMYVLTDDAVVGELSEMYNSIKYEETDEYIDISAGTDVYSLTFSNGNETLATIILDSNNNFVFSAGTQVYHIVSDFDYDRLKELIDSEIEEITSK